MTHAAAETETEREDSERKSAALSHIIPPVHIQWRQKDEPWMFSAWVYILPLCCEARHVVRVFTAVFPGICEKNKAADN